MTETKIKQSDINSAVWKACDTFRGVMDATQYKDYILVTLFLKYISDVWKDHYDEYKKQFDDEVRIRRKLERERFILPEGASFYDLYEQRNEVNLGELFNIALDKVEDANKSKLSGVFRNIDFNSEANLGQVKDRNRRLKMLLEDFYKPELDICPSRVAEDVIGNTYIYLIERFASDSGKKAGEFYTPHAVSKLVARLAQPKSGDRICDPSCGSGGLLIEAARAVGDNNYSLYGMEVSGSTWALCRMNMFLHGADSARIEWCNTLTNPALVEKDHLMKFNVIVANPPFSLDKWGVEEAEADRYKRFWRGIPPKSKGDYAFISHMIEAALEKEARVVVVVPHGVLFRGASEGRIRQSLIEENLLDAVIGLAPNLFPSTSIPVAILVFDKTREKGGLRETDKSVLFIDASKDYISGKNQNSLGDQHIERIEETFKQRKTIEKYSYLATVDEIRGNDFNLNIPRYVDTSVEEEEIDIQLVQKEIKEIEAELVKVKTQMEGYLGELGVSLE